MLKIKNGDKRELGFLLKMKEGDSNYPYEN
jgi:hypothetical protein